LLGNILAGMTCAVVIFFLTADLKDKFDISLLLLTIIISFAISFIIGAPFSYFLTRRLQLFKQKGRALLDNNFQFTIKADNHDEVGELAGLLNDISENLRHSFNIIDARNKELLETIEKDKLSEAERRDFTAAASHELKTPVAILKGYLEGMAFNVGQFADHKLYLQKALEVTDEMGRLIMEMIDINRLASTKYLKIEKFDLSALVISQVERISQLLGEKKQQLEIEVTPDLHINGDKKLFERAINNIMSNANKYSPENEKIIVRLLKQSENIILRITNTGVTIPEMQVDHLFDQFTRLEKSHNKETGGSGIGLYVVKKVMELHNFEYQLFNNKNATEFAIKISLEKNAQLI
jgi:two-component system sensor histidine kinase VanS